MLVNASYELAVNTVMRCPKEAVRDISVRPKSRLRQDDSQGARN